MKSLIKTLEKIIVACIIFIVGNIYSISEFKNVNWAIKLILVTLFLIINIVPSIYNFKLNTKRLRICRNGCELLCTFLISTIAAIIYYIIGFSGNLPIGTIVDNPAVWGINTLILVIVENIVFWNGIIRVYTTSVQLGIRWRVIGIICGWIPIVHIIVLLSIIKIVSDEVNFENNKILIDDKRKEDKLCATKYPLLLVHGVFFRDFRYLNYWGRIPKELEKNGASIYYGNHQSALSVEESAKELSNRIRQIIKETHCEKVNIIAHSKGGLDCRYALSMLGADKYVASLTTINTPHRGCEFADYLLSKVPKSKKEFISKMYNSTLKKLGDTNPNFIEAVSDLTASACKKRNELLRDSENVYYQSIGSKLNKPLKGKFPLNCTCMFVKYFDGDNDGLVGEKSFKWGSDYEFLTLKGKRGISHGDMIDLNRENIKGFDVREFYVKLVNGLKQKGF
ncbi:MAG: esterase/lipase family protein [Clostridium sp.]